MGLGNNTGERPVSVQSLSLPGLLIIPSLVTTDISMKEELGRKTSIREKQGSQLHIIQQETTSLQFYLKARETEGQGSRRTQKTAATDRKGRKLPRQRK